MDRVGRLQEEKTLLDRCIKHGRLPSAIKLAEHFRVSVPTIYNDLALLKAAGLTSIVSLRHSKGCAIEEVLNAAKS